MVRRGVSHIGLSPFRWIGLGGCLRTIWRSDLTVGQFCLSNGAVDGVRDLIFNGGTFHFCGICCLSLNINAN